MTPPDPTTIQTGVRDRISMAPRTVTIDPVTRIEGHLKIEVEVDFVQGERRVVDAWSTGTLFRGFERILQGRHPWDAIPITQRICGVCPVSHAMAASLAMDDIAGMSIPTNARLVRNIVLGANFIQSHILHFYHLAVLDFVSGPAMPPWTPSWEVDHRFDPATAAALVDHYVQALEMRRKAHELGAIFGGKLPHVASFVPGGVSGDVTAARVSQCQAYLNELIGFIDGVWLPDVLTLSSVYSDYHEVGAGPRNLLAYGVFDLDDAGAQWLLPAGRAVNGSTAIESLNQAMITEHVTRSWYEDADSALHPASGRTNPTYPKADGYSWLKAPRYGDAPYEAGPLARMWIAGDYRGGISVCDRHLARAHEARKIGLAMIDWLNALTPGAAVCSAHQPPEAGTGIGLTEAPRGALGHWASVHNHVIQDYQVITPTCWNAAPRDDGGVRGPIEQALIGTRVQSMDEPIEVLRVVHSFDPCLACAVHVHRPGQCDAVQMLTRT
jgi:hydrogenase large subunit